MASIIQLEGVYIVKLKNVYRTIRAANFIPYIDM